MTAPADLAVVGVGLVVALFGFPIQDRLLERAGVDAGGMAGHVAKWVPPAVLVGLVVFVEGRSLASIGWRFDGPASFAARCTGGLAVMLGASVVLSPLYARIGDGGEAMTEGLASFADLSVPERTFVAATAGTTEEVTYKGYAIERLATLTGSPLLAGALSMVAFTGVHLGDTWRLPSLVQIGQGALITTALYLYWRSLPVLIVVHALNDAVGLLLADRYADDAAGSAASGAPD